MDDLHKKYVKSLDYTNGITEIPHYLWIDDNRVDDIYEELAKEDPVFAYYADPDKSTPEKILRNPFYKEVLKAQRYDYDEYLTYLIYVKHKGKKMIKKACKNIYEGTYCSLSRTAANDNRSEDVCVIDNKFFLKDTASDEVKKVYYDTRFTIDSYLNLSDAIKSQALECIKAVCAYETNPSHHVFNAGLIKYFIYLLKLRKKINKLYLENYRRYKAIRLSQWLGTSTASVEYGSVVSGLIIKADFSIICRNILRPPSWKKLMLWSERMKEWKAHEEFCYNHIHDKYPNIELVRELEVIDDEGLGVGKRRFDIVALSEKKVYECKISIMAFNRKQYVKYTKIINHYSRFKDFTLIYIIDNFCVMHIGVYNIMYVTYEATDSDRKKLIELFNVYEDDIEEIDHIYSAL
jgi:hypothetical protein